MSKRSFFPQFLRERITQLQAVGLDEVILLVVVLIALFCSYCFIELADEVQEGDTQTFDEWVLRSLRQESDPAIPKGPVWLREASLDITALGSPAVLSLAVLGVAGFLGLQRRRREILLILVATTSGFLAMSLLKRVIERERPTIVPHLREVTEMSFPSGHAMLSAIVYLTIGILLTQVVPGRLAKFYCLLYGMVLSVLVGASRVYLGVHYPTDVLAGWMAGIAWALGWWIIARCLPWRPSKRTPEQPSAIA